ncbi:Translocon-associated protein subunit alpha [Fasciola gigantica]|uniref:Translocon-associated protein subunit alpha n=1 Tax=Fasciola gigantica TaxID=46835 RepID=A0A504Z3V8_FASGI|nr:Translocon-associated protein subunit alpha [Fasciola gigantica]
MMKPYTVSVLFYRIHGAKIRVPQTMWLVRWAALFSVLLCCSLLNAQDASVSEEEPEAPVSNVEPKEDPYEGSPHVQTVLTFVTPSLGLYSTKREIDLPAGKFSSILATLLNTHEGTSLPRFSLDLLEGSLHYPGYYDYYIQNFTKIRLQNTLEPGQEGSVYYKFRPALELVGRPFDLSIVAHYHDENGVYYAHRLFNQTINLYEVEEGIDTQMLFLVMLVIAVSIAVLVGLWHWCSSKAGRTHVAQKPSKSVDSDDTPVIENEYLALLKNPKVPKPGRSGNTVTRRQGKR